MSALRFFKTRETEIAWVDAMLDLTNAKTDMSVKLDAAGKVYTDGNIMLFLILISHF